MLNKARSRIFSYIDNKKVESIIVLAVFVVIFSLMNNTPYLSVLFENFFVKIAAAWLVMVFVFNVRYVAQVLLCILLIALLFFTYLFGSGNYETIGSAIFGLILVATFFYLFSGEK